MQHFGIANGTGLLIESAGIALIAALSFFMTRSIRRMSLGYWTVSWSLLLFALSALAASVYISALVPISTPVYFLGEYAFVYMFLAGCRNRASGAVLLKRELRLVMPAGLLAVVLSRIPPAIGFMIHFLVIAILFAAAYRSLQPARKRGLAAPGLTVMSAALLLLTIDFGLYFAASAYVTLFRGALPLAYQQFSSVYNLILEILLGFGTVMVVMDDVRQEVEAANLELTKARDRLEVLARMDPLTEALNRHAFYSLLEGKGRMTTEGVYGCVVVVDIDDLKPINDSAGHAAGDNAIRAVASSIRGVIRAGDLLFRWGGDEFLVLLFGVAEQDARDRIEGLNNQLSIVPFGAFASDQCPYDSAQSGPPPSDPPRITVSFGVAAFRGLAEIEAAMDRADADMYARKQAAKSSGQVEALLEAPAITHDQLR